MHGQALLPYWGMSTDAMGITSGLAHPQKQRVDTSKLGIIHSIVNPLIFKVLRIWVSPRSWPLINILSGAGIKSKVITTELARPICS